MANQVFVTSQGTLNTTSITLNGDELSDILGFRIYQEPGIDQVGCEFTYLEGGSIKRWVGANEDDTLDITITHSEGDSDHKVTASAKEMKYFVEGARVFKGASMIASIAADGWSFQVSHWFNLKEEAPLVISHM